MIVAVSMVAVHDARVKAVIGASSVVTIFVASMVADRVAQAKDVTKAQCRVDNFASSIRVEEVVASSKAVRRYLTREANTVHRIKNVRVLNRDVHLKLHAGSINVVHMAEECVATAKDVSPQQ